MHSPSQLLSTGHKQKREKSCNIHSPYVVQASLLLTAVRSQIHAVFQNVLDQKY